MKANEFPYRLEEVRRKSANRRFYRKREVKMTSEQLAAVEAARARWKYYQKKPTSMGEAPFVEATKAGVKAEKLTTEHAGKARAKGISLFQLAGKPTKEQFQMVYGERGHSMTWAQRAAAGVTAEKFQEALRAKQQAKQTAVTRLAASKIT